ncbi:Mitochondrial pyruvate carrier 1 [Merluccius polli]|uniref:Mitochondrial pyruvate carrier 1 n=1 Tax=Merluccius polli TaxID=89951 RepID=A0AA47MY23_MERPO|nr:Mitochondrial pyruvate carrier 1 [Merluccius polli]
MKKSPEIISGRMTFALTCYSLLFMRFAYKGSFTERKSLFCRNTLITFTQLHIHTWKAAQYNHSLTCWPLSSSTAAGGVKGLAQGHLSGGNEGGASAT